MRKEDINNAIPHYEKILANAPAFLGNGGSCIAAPDGSWVIEPVTEKEALLLQQLILKK